MLTDDVRLKAFENLLSLPRLELEKHVQTADTETDEIAKSECLERLRVKSA